MKRGPWWAMGAGVLALDQGLKAWVERHLALGERLPVVPPLLSVTRVHNTGAAFGLFPQGAAAFLAAAAVATVLLGAFLLSGRARGLWGWGAALVAAGALGNLIDRVRLGYVLDFLELPHFPVFNVADAAIVLGAFLLGLGLLRSGR
ncbi:MAG: signal peptidase II [Candidatus Bipolaricaulaceae bacterium]